MHFQARKRYSPDFRRQAAERSLSSRETVTQFAAKLGVHPGVLTRWRRDYMMTQDSPDTATKKHRPVKSSKQMAQEIARLEKKLQRVELENAILKKATEYFTKNPQ